MQTEQQDLKKNKSETDKKTVAFKGFHKEEKTKLFSQTHKKQLLKKAFIIAEAIFKKKF